MEMVIYLDVLLLSNWWADFFLLQTAARMTHTPVRRRRLLFGALVGALCTLVIFLPPMPAAIVWLMRLMGAVLMCSAAFSPCPWKRWLRLLVMLFICGAVFSGVIFTVGQQLAPNGLLQSNGVLYADVSLWVLLLGTAAGSAVSAAAAKRNRQTQTASYRIRMKLRQGEWESEAVCDTGNTLCDPFSGMPVILCHVETGGKSAEQIAAAQKGFRMLQVQTVTGQRLLPACMPEHITLYEKEKAYPIRAVVAFTEESVPALFPPAILP